MAVGSTQLFVTSFSSPGSVWRVPLAGGAPVMLVDQLAAPTDVAAVGDRVFFGAPHRFDPATPERSAALEAKDGAALALTTGDDQAGQLAIDADGAFWATYLDRSVFRTPIDGSKTRVLVAELEGAAEIQRVRSDPRSICFTASVVDTAGTHVYRIAKRLSW